MSRTKSAVARNAVNDAAVAAERPVLDRREWFQIYRHAYWVAIEREDEIWAVVAFLTQIQKLDAKAYRDLALGNVHVPNKRCRACDTRVRPQGVFGLRQVPRR
jgi:hypothetical protein